MNTIIGAVRNPLVLPTEIDDEALADLASRIANAVTSAESCARDAVAYALQAGALLIQAKQKVGHGGWLAWLDKNVTMAPRTCQAYMRLAEKVPLLPPAEARRVADLPLREAVRAMTTNPSAHPPNPRVHFENADRKRLVEKLRHTSNVLRRFSRHLDKISTDVDIDRARAKDIERARLVLIKALDELKALDVPHAA